MILCKRMTQSEMQQLKNAQKLVRVCDGSSLNLTAKYSEKLFAH